MKINNPEIGGLEDGSFERPYVVSNLTREQAIDYPDCPEKILEQLELLSVKYLSQDNQFYEGQLVIHNQLVNDVKELFSYLVTLPEEQHFPIASIKPIIMFNNDDEASMQANNSSGFNYRNIEGQDKLSNHSYGLAIDLNPQQNPVIIDGKITQPSNGEYNPEVPGTLFEGHPVVKFLKDRGWEWGGDWKTKKDYQHFQKLIQIDEKI